jgi:hypothetical protein
MRPEAVLGRQQGLRTANDPRRNQAEQSARSPRFDYSKKQRMYIMTIVIRVAAAM